MQHEHAARPLRALWDRQRRYRSRVVLAVVMSSVNKVADVIPELLIGAAVDVVVNGEDCFVSSVLDVDSRFEQLVWLAVINAVFWMVESASEYAAAPAVAGPGTEHRARPAGPGLRPRPAPRPHLARVPAARARRWPRSTTT